MQKNTEQIKLENDQIEVIVNYHGAELRSLKKKATEQEYLWNADAKYWQQERNLRHPIESLLNNFLEYFIEYIWITLGNRL